MKAPGPQSVVEPGSGSVDGDWLDKIQVLHVVVLFIFLVIPTLGSMPLFEPDEGRYAEIPREMLASGDLLAPRLNGVLYFEKPPLYYWLVAGAQAAIGRTELASRMVSLLAALLGIALTYRLGKSVANHRVGVCAALMLAVTPMWAIFARLNSIDMLVSVLLTATLASFWWASREGAGRAAWYWVFICSALAVLTKGLIGVVLPGGVIFIYLLASKRWKLLLRVPWISGTALFLLLAAPWHLLLAQRHSDFLWFYFVREHFLRYSSDIAERHGAFWYYLPVLVVGFLPWFGLLPGTWRLFRQTKENQDKESLIFLCAWAGFIVFFFSISKSKLTPYILPVWPALAILAARALIEVRRRSSPMDRGTVWGLAGSNLLLTLLLGSFAVVSSGLRLEQLGNVSFRVPLLFITATAGVILSLLALWFLLRRVQPQGIFLLLLVSCVFLFSVALAGSEVAKGRTAKAIAECILDGPPDRPVAAFKTYPQSLPFYLDRKIDVVNYQGELGYGISKLEEEQRRLQYPEMETFLPRWNSDSPMYMVIQRRHLQLMEDLGMRAGTILLQERKLVLVTNERNRKACTLPLPVSAI